MEVNVNGENDPMAIDRVSLDTDLSPGRLPAYGEVLAGVLDGDPLLAVRGDTAVDCWRIIDPVLEAWRGGPDPARVLSRRVARTRRLADLRAPEQ